MAGYVNGVHLLPATGEWTYDTRPRLGKRVIEPSLLSINRYAFGGSGDKTDFSLAMDQLQADLPDCKTVSLIVAWFGDSLNIASGCNIYPSTTYINGQFQDQYGNADSWRCSGLTQTSPGLIPIPQNGSSFVYGGTPSDQSILQAIGDLKARGFRVVFYPFLLMTASGFPWRGRITYQPGSDGWPTGDVSSAAANAVSAFLGSASPDMFSANHTLGTVDYSGSPTDWTFRRFILHYAALCAMAGGVDLFLIGSEMRGLEQIRGPGWTKAGVVGADGFVTWDYPFVNGLIALANDARSIFDAAGLTKDLAGRHNLIAYSADWSAWMGLQHPGENGQWPHLDQLYASPNIDLVGFDNYLPLSDWTTAGGLDVLHWSDARSTSWPPPAANMNGLGLSGTPSLKNKDYLKANIEGGEKYHWYYNDSNNQGRGLDPNGTGLQVSRPLNDRAAQARNPYYANQQLLANKQIRWWWNNQHQAIYDAGDGAGWAPHGPFTQWAAQSKSIAFVEYGFPTCDKGTNQPNVFYDPKSVESFTPFWSAWESSDGGGFRPVTDDELVLLALQAVHEYWFVDGNNETSGAGLPMIEPLFCSVWSWDARPFPVFPNNSGAWGDAANWRAGNWLGGKGPFITPAVADAPPVPPAYPAFPMLSGQGWSVHKMPTFSTRVVTHISGREVRSPFYQDALYEFDLTFDGLSSGSDYPGLGNNSLQALMGLYIACQGQYGTFLYTDPTDNAATNQTIATGDGTATQRDQYGSNARDPARLARQVRDSQGCPRTQRDRGGGNLSRKLIGPFPLRCLVLPSF